MDKNYNSAASQFWTDRGDACTVLGDVLGRLPAIELLAPKPNEHVLDVGCGAGWCTRRLAHTGARVTGFDVSDTMLAAAMKAEQQKPLGITYLAGDLKQIWPIESQSVDAIYCYGVLMHVNPEEVLHFFGEARRVLRIGGRMVISVSHHEVFRLQEANPSFKPGWVSHDRGTWDAGGNALAVEHYFNGSGEEFVSETWMHRLTPAALKAGFELLEHHNRIVTRESLTSIYGERSASWPTGFAAFEQILVR